MTLTSKDSPCRRLSGQYLGRLWPSVLRPNDIFEQARERTLTLLRAVANSGPRAPGDADMDCYDGIKRNSVRVTCASWLPGVRPLLGVGQPQS